MSGWIVGDWTERDERPGALLGRRRHGNGTGNRRAPRARGLLLPTVLASAVGAASVLALSLAAGAAVRPAPTGTLSVSVAPPGPVRVPVTDGR